MNQQEVNTLVEPAKKKPYHIWCEPIEEFFKRIDSLGGWPVGAKFVTMQHSFERERPCYFNNVNVRDEWNTTISSCDDYYYWKISKEFKDALQHKIEIAFCDRIRSII